MGDDLERARFDRLVREDVIGHLPATPLATRLRGWVEGAQPGDPMVEEILSARTEEDTTQEGQTA